MNNHRTIPADRGCGAPLVMASHRTMPRAKSAKFALRIAAASFGVPFGVTRERGRALLTLCLIGQWSLLISCHIGQQRRFAGGHARTWRLARVSEIS